MESKSKIQIKGYEFMNSHNFTEDWLKPLSEMPELKTKEKNPNPVITVLIKEGRKL